jgi:endonuclease YncB( thermonuclease family)
MGNCICVEDPYVAEPIPQWTADVYRLCTDINTPYVSYENIKQLVKILRIVDGDTVDAAMYHQESKKIFKYRIRMYGIDTPESKPLKSNPDREQEMAAAKMSKQAMIDKMQENNNVVVVKLYKPDKYGRLLGTFYGKNEENINDWMVKQGHAIAYFGKTKKSFSEAKQGQTQGQSQSSDESDCNRSSYDDIYQIDKNIED